MKNQFVTTTVWTPICWSAMVRDTSLKRNQWASQPPKQKPLLSGRNLEHVRLLKHVFFPFICHVFQLAAVNLQENDRNIFNLLNPLNKISEGDPNPKRYTFFGQLYSDTIVGQPHPVRKKNNPPNDSWPAMPLAWPKSAKSPDLKDCEFDKIADGLWAPWVVWSSEEWGPPSRSLQMEVYTSPL